MIHAERDEAQNQITGNQTDRLEQRSFGRLSHTAAMFAAATALGLAEAPKAEAASSNLNSTRDILRSPRAEANSLINNIVVHELQGELTLGQLNDYLKETVKAAGGSFQMLLSTDRQTRALSGNIEVELRVDRPTSLRQVLNHIAEQVGADGLAEATWQVFHDGRVQFGAKEDLNRYAERKIYSIEDLLMRIPNFDNAPQLDLNSALQQGGQRGGSGDGGLIGDPGEDVQRESKRDVSDELQEIIRTFVEPEQWYTADFTMRVFEVGGVKVLIVSAPAYVHAQIGGELRD